MPHKEAVDKKIEKTFIKRQKNSNKRFVFFQGSYHFRQSQIDSMSFCGELVMLSLK